jgi:hypothetical protein
MARASWDSHQTLSGSDGGFVPHPDHMNPVHPVKIAVSLTEFVLPFVRIAPFREDFTTDRSGIDNAKSQGCEGAKSSSRLGGFAMNGSFIRGIRAIRGSIPSGIPNR